jgi:hypothetical protein
LTSRIITTHYRYKRPPGKRKAVAIEVPAIVTAAGKARRRVSSRDDTPAEAESAQPSANDDCKPGHRHHQETGEAGSPTCPT